MTLKTFPRGGKDNQKSPKPKVQKYNQNDKQKTPSQREKKKKVKEAEELNLIVDTANRLSYATVQEGITVLGCVFEITDYNLRVSLPGGIIGFVQAIDISDSYTNMLQNLLNSEGNRTSEFKSLSELYSPGDYIVCYVEGVESEEKKGVKLSLEPRLINQTLNVNSLEVGSKVVCSVSSVEDHGCIVDIGLSSVRAFIPKKEKKSEQTLFPGRQLLCSVRNVETNENTAIINLSTEKKYVKAVQETEVTSLDSLVPGIKFNLTVKTVLSNGLCVSFGGNYIGYINQLYLDNPLSQYSVGMEVTGTLLYIIPTVKLAHFHLLIDKKIKHNIKPGDVVEEAVTLFRETGGFVFQLTESGVRGFVPMKKINIHIDKIQEQFTPGSKHKCRVLLYNRMDCTFVCSMQPSVMSQKYFSLAEFQPGDVVKVKLTKINPNAGVIHVTCGNIYGYVPSEHISDTGVSGLTKFKFNDEVQARVLSIDMQRQKLNFTLKKSLIESKLPVLSNIQQVKHGVNYHGTVIMINKYGLLVKFFGDIKGWIPASSLNKSSASENWNFSVGQTVTVNVQSVDETASKMILNLASKKVKKDVTEFAIGEQVEGTIMDSSTQGVYLRINKNDGKTVSTGFLPAGHMSPCVEIASLLASKCIPGDTLSSLVFSTVPSLILTRTFLPQEKYRHFEHLKVGDSIPCTIRDVEQDGVRVILPLIGGEPFGYVPYNNINHINLLRAYQILFAKITSIKTGQLGLTMTLKDVYDGLTDKKSRNMAAVDTLNLYFNKLTELANYTYYEDRPISKVKLGQTVEGKIDKVTEDGLVILLPHKLLGIVSKDHYTGDVKKGDTVFATIMWKNYVHELVEMTMLPSLIRGINAKQSTSVQVPPEQLIRGKILMVTQWFVLILMKGRGKGTLAALPVRRHMNDIEPDLSPYNVHSKIRCYLVLNSDETNIIPICMVKSAFEEEREVKVAEKRKKTHENEEVPVKKIKIKKEEENGKVLKKKTKAKVEKNSNSKEEVEIKVENIKEEDDEGIDKHSVKEKPITIPACGFYWDDNPDFSLYKDKKSSSDSDDEIKQQPTQKKKKLNAAERREQERQKEREIRQREEALVSNQLPNSVDQFDRLVLSSPDSSIVWLQYMAFHMQATEMEKARAVARRAIKTINFREEGERLNVWNAWMNLESKFGTPESLNDVFQEAVRTNDSLKVYTHMLTVHTEAGRQAELEKTITTMIGKFKHIPQVWIDCGTAFLQMGLKEKSRHIMQRALQSLPANEHINLMVKFALLENKFGDRERAQTLFEQILSSYPKRVDIWSCYVDSLVKSNDIDLARKVLERAVVQTLPPRKMKALFKKFISFENEHGTPQGATRVQEMAAEYVEKQCSKES